MVKVEQHIGVRDLGSLRVDVEIVVEGHDGEEALEWTDDLENAIKEAVDGKKEGDDGGC